MRLRFVLLLAGLALVAPTVATAEDQKRLPSKALVRGVPFVSWRQAAQLDYEGKNQVNPSVPASSMIIAGYWHPEIKTDREQLAAAEKAQWGEPKNAASLDELKALVASGSPVRIKTALTPAAHPFHFAMQMMLAVLKPEEFKLKEGPHSRGILGPMIALEQVPKFQKALENKPGSRVLRRFNWLEEGMAISSRVLIGYDDERQLVTLHDATFGPAWEVSYEDFDRMWSALDRQYSVVPPPANAAAVLTQRAASEYRPRAADERAAEQYILGYALSATGRAEEGEQHFGQGLAIPGMSTGYRHLLLMERAIALQGMGRYDDAIESATLATKTIPEDYLPWDVLRTAYPLSTHPDRERLAAEATAEVDKIQARGQDALLKRLAEIIPSDFYVEALGTIRGWASPIQSERPSPSTSHPRVNPRR